MCWFKEALGMKNYSHHCLVVSWLIVYSRNKTHILHTCEWGAGLTDSSPILQLSPLTECTTTVYSCFQSCSVTVLFRPLQSVRIIGDFQLFQSFRLWNFTIPILLWIVRNPFINNLKPGTKPTSYPSSLLVFWHKILTTGKWSKGQRYNNVYSM